MWRQRHEKRNETESKPGEGMGVGVGWSLRCGTHLDLGIAGARPPCGCGNAGVCSASQGRMRGARTRGTGVRGKAEARGGQEKESHSTPLTRSLRKTGLINGAEGCGYERQAAPRSVKTTARTVVVSNFKSLRRITRRSQPERRCHADLSLVDRLWLVAHRLLGPALMRAAARGG
jgi:hypothetical protein